MEWSQLAIFVFTMIGVMLWLRSESRADCRRVEDLLAAMKDDISKEMKDFHGRLCKIEERYLQIISRKD